MFCSPPQCLPDDLTADEYLSLGCWYVDTNDYANARQAMQRVIDMAPEAPESLIARYYLIQRLPPVDACAAAVKQLEELSVHALFNSGGVIEGCRKLVAENPSFAGAHRVLGLALLGESKVEEAIESLERSLAINPQDIDALCHLAEAYITIMDYPKAQACLNEAASALLPQSVDSPPAAGMHRRRYEELNHSLQVLMAMDQ